MGSDPLNDDVELTGDETPPEFPGWTDSVNGSVKTNGKLHIWSDDSHAAVITSDYYVRP